MSRAKSRYGARSGLVGPTALGHQIGTSISAFKVGSTSPVKSQLKNASGSVVQAATAPVSLTPQK